MIGKKTMDTSVSDWEIIIKNGSSLNASVYSKQLIQTMEIAFYLLCAIVVHAYGGYALLGILFKRFTNFKEHE